QGHALRENLVIVGRGGEQSPHRDIDTARLFVGILSVSQVRLMDDLRESLQAPIVEAGSLHQRLERAVLALMAQLYARRVERNRIVWKLGGRREQKLRFGVDESLDQPRRRDAIDVRSWTRHPSAPFEFREIEGGLLLTPHWFRTPSPHGDDLLETPYLGSTRGPEEVDVTNALVILGKTCQLLVHSRALGRGLLLELLEEFSIPRGELAIVVIARLVEQA